MNKAIYSVLGILSAAVTVFCVVMFVMAISFGELGRVVFYMAGWIIFGELAVLSFLKLRKLIKNP